MNFHSVFEFGTEFYVLIFLLLIAVDAGYRLGKYKKHKLIRENIGEVRVRNLLSNYCKGRHAHLLNNITLRLLDGSTTQVDHILICHKGVFVIETKNFGGWIFGNPKSKFWTQVFYHSSFRFQNPLFQNYRHVKAIQSLLDFLSPNLVQNIVVFVGEASFRTDVPDNICHLKDLISKIEQFPENSLSLKLLKYCVGILEYLRLEITQETDVEHQANLVRRLGL